MKIFVAGATGAIGRRLVPLLVANGHIPRGRRGGRTREAYPGSTWERLVAVKRRYDPANLFRLNHNISPTSSS